MITLTKPRGIQCNQYILEISEYAQKVLQTNLYASFSNHIGDLLDKQCFKNSIEFSQHAYLQSEIIGPYSEDTTLNVHGEYIRYVTDMDTFLLILRTGILSPDAANSLVDELYSQGLIKPRSNHA